MKFDQLVHVAGNLPFFDLPALTQASGEPKKHLLTQLSQWKKSNKITQLRRGLYSLSDPYRKASLSPLHLANELYRPSYLSGIWALAYYGLIPEKVIPFTSVTTRVTRTFQNSLGLFTYSSLKKDFFWGMVSQKMKNIPVWIAEPEKGLLDYFHLNSGEWTTDRIKEMRFQNLEEINFEKLTTYVKQWGSARLMRTILRLKDFL
ncbi:MAG: hypothetical protein HY877_05100 [Deltaproteobacteria bacterium]|nr:hypothetical protein [Deltaproteobacteria bacterium]